MAEAAEQYASLRRNVSYLGRILGEVIAEADGEDQLAFIERVRLLSRDAREGAPEARDQLLERVNALPDEELVPVARAFSQFLNLANIAEERHYVSREMESVFAATTTLNACLAQLQGEGVAQQDIAAAVKALRIDLVLTAHPTEITRRTLIHKHREIGACLDELELSGRTAQELESLDQRLRDLVAQIWYGMDFRKERPTPVDEAKWGFAVVEDSLWEAVPRFLRKLDATLTAHDLPGLALDAAPVRFTFWMGGDRDGNPNVTAAVTEEVLLLARWQAASLYQRDITHLIDELSMSRCSDEVSELTGGAREPYRALLKPVRAMIRRTLERIKRRLDQLEEGDAEPLDEAGTLTGPEQLLEPLLACYRSMHACGMQLIAERDLLDVIRRVYCFGTSLVKLDIRQESDRHTQALDELTRYLDLGSYREWDEAQRMAFLLEEMASKRPLIPVHWSPSADTQEVLDTCAVIAKQRPAALGAYVISMARAASDVLAVRVLLKASGCTFHMPVAPLFETLDDLENASSVIDTLLDTALYRQSIADNQMVMIGYSDSSKDAGVLAAAWAQYRAQEGVLQSGRAHGVKITLFHGRGGTIGRGGAPAHHALLSQPPGTLRNGLRVTEQGEMIRTKLGLSSLAVKTFALYASAIFKANLLRPPEPSATWRATMDSMAAESTRVYRSYVRGHPDFVEYFRHATPEQELAILPLGSRPARRRGGKGVESLRAIPWIFSWMQNRLMLPAWLGVGSALRQALEAGEGETLREMAQHWPFFASLLSMQGMVFSKADADLSAYYDERLVPPSLQSIGDELRTLLLQDTQTLEAVHEVGELSPQEAWGQESIRLRNVYTDPLNFLQVESLSRQRDSGDERYNEAVMVTIAGIAAGMRNTG